MDLDLTVKLAVYLHFAATGMRPDLAAVARAAGVARDEVRAAFSRLQERRVLVLEADGESILMAPPFSGVPTRHEVEVDGRMYFANCAWDSLGIPAALHRPALVRSRCGMSEAPLRLMIASDGPAPCDWRFHCAVPAARWWNDIVYT
jgi:hypothetical protein